MALKIHDPPVLTPLIQKQTRQLSYGCTKKERRISRDDNQDVKKKFKKSSVIKFYINKIFLLKLASILGLVELKKLLIT